MVVTDFDRFVGTESAFANIDKAIGAEPQETDNFACSQSLIFCSELRATLALGSSPKLPKIWPPSEMHVRSGFTSGVLFFP